MEEKDIRQKLRDAYRERRDIKNSFNEEDLYIKEFTDYETGIKFKASINAQEAITKLNEEIKIHENLLEELI